MTTIAFIGMGIMGSAMAANIAKAGRKIRVFNRTPNRPGEAKARVAGAEVTRTVEETVRDASIIAMCLGDEQSVSGALFDEGGIVQFAHSKAKIIDFTTIGPQAARQIANKLASRNIEFRDAPVTGGEPAAEAGTLTVMFGGCEEDADAFQDVLQPVSGKVVSAGNVGGGQALKMLNQLLCGVNIVGVCEALMLAHRLKIAPEILIEGCGNGAAGSWQLLNLGKKAASGDYAPGFRVEHMRKDLRLLAQSFNNDLPPAATHAKECFDNLVRTFEQSGQLGTQALFELYR